MTTSEDVSNLFRKFGGEPEQYQELSRDSHAEESKARWPLLASLRLAELVVAPSVRDGRQPVTGAPVPHLQGREQVAGVSPFASVPEVSRETVRLAAASAASAARRSFAMTGHAAPGATGDRGERILERLAGVAGAASASAAASVRSSLTASIAAPDPARAAGQAVMAPTPSDGAAREGVASGGARPLSAVFAKLAAEEPATGRTPGPQKSSLFARLSRL